MEGAAPAEAIISKINEVGIGSSNFPCFKKTNRFPLESLTNLGVAVGNQANISERTIQACSRLQVITFEGASPRSNTTAPSIVFF
jgi:hypothetical protein